MSKITDEYLRLWKDDHVQERARRPMSADEESFEELIDEAIASRADLQVAREALEHIVNASGMDDLDDYYEFVDQEARAVLALLEGKK